MIFIYFFLGIYILAMLFILFYSFAQAHLLYHFFQFKKNPNISLEPGAKDLPKVTVQLPIYNEMYVVERLIDAVSKFRYPSDKIEIQILDDSTDETSQIIRRKLKEFPDVNFKYIHRIDRKGFKAGASYKTAQYFSDFEFKNTYLDNSTGTNKFNMDYPAILSFGLGYSKSDFDFALDYRMVDYENTDGFSETGWTPTASVAGFGWDNISIVSAGIQYKGVNKFPLRLGYTYSSNPISNDVAMFNIPATAVIKNAYQLGFSYLAGKNIVLDAVYHHGTSSGKTSGQLLNPMFVSSTNPYGAIPGSNVSYDMTTDLIMVGISYTFSKKQTN